jgi:hypothetical protein
MMQLSNYPGVIVQAAQRVNEIDSQLMAVQQQINRFEGNADRMAAFEIDFKNVEPAACGGSALQADWRKYPPTRLASLSRETKG